MERYSHRNYVAAANAQRRVGQWLEGEWQLNALLGIGQRSVCYAAAHRSGRRATVKVIELHSGVDPAQGAKHYAELLNAVNHAGVVRIEEMGITSDAHFYLVTELLAGETLDRYLNRVNVAVNSAHAVHITALLLDILAVAHRSGFEHRGLGQSNVLITPEGEIKLLDLGLAQLLDFIAPGLSPLAVDASEVPSIAPPELALGVVGEADARTDIWAVGALLFQLLTGADPLGIIAAQPYSLGVRPARKLADALPSATPELCLLVDRALSVDKRDRWFDADAMLRAVHRMFGIQAPRLKEQQLMVPVAFSDHSGRLARDDDDTLVWNPAGLAAPAAG
jgi:serine/threonine-protein kinase